MGDQQPLSGGAGCGNGTGGGFNMAQVQDMITTGVTAAMVHQQQQTAGEGNRLGTPARPAVNLKVDLQHFTREKDQWGLWSAVHRAQSRSIGCDDAVDVPTDQVIHVGRVGFDSTSIDAISLHCAENAYKSLITMCKLHSKW